MTQRLWTIHGALFLAGAVISSGETFAQDSALLKDVVVEAASIQISATDQNLWRPILNPGGDAFRVKVKIAKPGANARWSLVFRDEQQVVERIPATQFETITEWYSLLLSGTSARIEIEGDATGFNGLTVQSILRKPRPGAIPQSVGNPILNYDSAAVNPHQRALARSVAKLELGTGATCTGFLIGAQHLLTNRHCVNRSVQFSANGSHSPGPCGDILVLFDYSSSNRAASRQVRCAAAYVHPQLDLGILEIPTPGGDPRQALVLNPQQPTPSTNVYAIGHPLGRPLTFTRCCGFFDFDQQWGTHDCPTYSGGSGSPIFDADGKVVAINVLTDYNDPSLTPIDVEQALARGITFRSKALLLSNNEFVNRFRSQ